MNLPKTKIVATLGPASNAYENIVELIKAGVNVFRINFSHGTHEGHKKLIDRIHKANKELATKVGILADLQGPKIRLGKLKEEPIPIKIGDKLTFTTNKAKEGEMYYISYEDLAIDVNVHDKILIDDGKIELKVTKTNGVDTVETEVVFGGDLKSNKGVNLPETNLTSPSLTPKDIVDLDFILTQNVNWIALSFVRTADEIMRLKGMIEYKAHPAKVIAKIEKPEAIQNIDAIIRVSDAIMLARGDLGVEMPLERIPLMQKEIINKCRYSAKPIVIATQMMESMIENPTPTRAEITDVSTAIFDGADALMLSGETAVGKHTVKVIETIRRVIGLVEAQPEIYNRYQEPIPYRDGFLSDAICLNACRIAEQVNAKGIIAMTKSGYTAFELSSHRPRAGIFVFTESNELLNSVSLIWGVRAFHYDKFVSTDETIRDVQKILKDNKVITSGDAVINTGAMPLNQRGKTNMIKVTRIR